MRPLSCGLTCSVNVTPGELAAPMTLDAAKNSVAPVKAIASKVFFSIEVLLD
jgi:hypothetical protein